jgi:nicotinamide-nucleotide amidase
MSTPPPAATVAASAAVLAIGDEVLRGEVINSNAAFLGDALFELGFIVREHRVISDDVADIRRTLERLTAEVDVILCTGGLGPTDDDRTVDVVSGMLGAAPTTHEPSLERMKAGFAARGFALTPNNLRQVRVPAGAEALPNRAGIAPGFTVTLGRAQAFFLPGIPQEMKRIFADHILPRLAELRAASGMPRPAVRTFHVFGMGESHIDHRLDGIVDSLATAAAAAPEPQVAVHYRTSTPENHVKLVVRGPDPVANLARLEQLAAEVQRRLGDVVYGVDDVTFPLAVARALEKAGATLALAESCTGGYAGQLLTSEPGASGSFVGGVVSYADKVKTGVLGVQPQTLAAHGAVSEACALEMAEGVRRLCGATLGVSITGLAGSIKEAGVEPAAEVSPGGKPVGTVCLAVAGPQGSHSETKQFFGGRERIRRSAAYRALDMARRYFAEIR